MTDKGKLILIPNVIADDTQAKVLSPQIYEVVRNVRHFLAEDIRTARRFLSQLKVFSSIESLEFNVLDKDTDERQLHQILKPILDGYDVGVISESGCPGVADPGALAVKYAHQHRIEVVPLIGPSSILLALMGSGLNGQKFAFHGYLPIDYAEASKTIKDLEYESKKKNQTQIFIETPYRNNQLMEKLLRVLSPEVSLCIAVDITGSDQFIRANKVREWRVQTVEIPKKPAVFLFLA